MKKVIIICMGGTWGIFPAMYCHEGKHFYPDMDNPYGYCEKGTTLVDICNTEEYSIVNCDCLLNDLQKQLKY
jgi:hypothetical protein